MLQGLSSDESPESHGHGLGGSSEVATPLVDPVRPTPGTPDIADTADTAMLPDDDQASHTPGYLPVNVRPSAFGHTLEPALRRACEGRLSDVTWFRVDWQRGGALTGYGTWRDDGEDEHRVVVKLPVPPCERHWLVTLQGQDHVAPRVFAHGEAVNGYDLAWVVMERLSHGPLGSAWLGNEFDLLTEAVGRFYAAAEQHPRVGEPVRKDWFAIFERSRKHVHDFSLSQPQRWNRALKKAHRQLKQWVDDWEHRPSDHWCHGDLHFGNAMTRIAAPEGPAVLFDFARTHVGHWVEDAVFFEHLFWARRKRLNGRKLCSQIAHERKTRGLKVDEHWPHFADLKRALLAMSTPAMLQHDGDPRHVKAVLEVLERSVG